MLYCNMVFPMNKKAPSLLLETKHTNSPWYHSISYKSPCPLSSTHVLMKYALKLLNADKRFFLRIEDVSCTTNAFPHPATSKKELQGEFSRFHLPSHTNQWLSEKLPRLLLLITVIFYIRINMIYFIITILFVNG